MNLLQFILAAAAIVQRFPDAPSTDYRVTVLTVFWIIPNGIEFAHLPSGSKVIYHF